MSSRRARTIYLIHHSHTDIGYTETQQRIERWHVAFLRQAVEIAERRPDFRWTCEVFWPVERFLAQADADERERFVAMVRAGRIGLSANYLNFSELAGEEVLVDVCARACTFGRIVDLPVRCAMTADINGFGWGFAQALFDAGVENLFTCVHTHHGRYPLDHPQQGFWWETPRGDRLLVWSGEHYHHGNELGLAPGATSSYRTKDDCDADMIFHDPWGVAERRIPRYWKRLAEAGYPFDFAPVMVSGLRTDNGPPSEAVLEQVNRWNDAHGAEYPVRMASLEETFERLRREADGLPVQRGDWPDWWSDGPASMPRGVRIHRKAQRDLRRALRLRYDLPATARAETITQLALFAEHTFGHSDSIATPWLGLAQTIAARKEAYAALASEKAAALLDEALEARGLAHPSPGAPLAWRVLNPSKERVAGLAVLEVGFYEYAELCADDRVVVRRASDGAAVPFERAPVPRGMGFLVPVDLEAGAARDFVLEAHPGEPPEPDAEARPHDRLVLETPFVRIGLDPERGIASWQDAATGEDLLRADRRHAPFQPLREVTPMDGPEHALSVRGAMDLNRKGPDVRRSTGRSVRIDPVRRSAVRDLVSIHYSLDGCSEVVLEIAAHRHAARVDVQLRLHKTSTWDPENLYFALPFAAGADDTFWVGKPGCVLRPWLDQVPGTLTDFTCVDEGVAWCGPAGGIALSLLDQPLLQLGPLDPGPRKLAGDPSLSEGPTQVYAWPLNNFWETNFAAEAGGFHAFRYVVSWGEDLASPAVAVERTRAQALDLTTIRLAQTPIGTTEDAR